MGSALPGFDWHMESLLDKKCHNRCIQTVLFTDPDDFFRLFMTLLAKLIWSSDQCFKQPGDLSGKLSRLMNQKDEMFSQDDWKDSQQYRRMNHHVRYSDYRRRTCGYQQCDLC